MYLFAYPHIFFSEVAPQIFCPFWRELCLLVEFSGFYMFWIQVFYPTCNLQIFSPSPMACLFIFVTVPFKGYSFLNFDTIQFIDFCVCCIQFLNFTVESKKSLPNPVPQRISSLFSSTSLYFKVLHLSHFESCFWFLPMDI